MSTSAPAVRRKRPARPQFASTMLILEAVLVLFATLVGHGLAMAGSTDLSVGATWAIGGVIMVVLVALSRVVDRPGGYVAGSVAQLSVLAVGFVIPMMFIVAGVFVLLWVVALQLGGRIDRERAQWDAAHPGQTSD